MTHVRDTDAEDLHEHAATITTEVLHLVEKAVAVRDQHRLQIDALKIEIASGHTLREELQARIAQLEDALARSRYQLSSQDAVIVGLQMELERQTRRPAPPGGLPRVCECCRPRPVAGPHDTETVD